MCGGPRRFAVLHGARHSWDLGYRSELMNLQHLCRNFTYLPDDQPAGGRARALDRATGYVQDCGRRRAGAGLGLPADPENTHVFLCGSPAMIDDTVAMLAKEGYCEHTRNSRARFTSRGTGSASADA